MLRVRWTIVPRTAPQPWIACSGCGGLRAFRSSGKIRLNANGRRLDAWLIYKCLTCGKTWNRPIFERQNVGDIDPGVLEALQSNDPSWIHGQTFNLEALRRKSQRIDEFSDVDVERRILRENPGWTKIAIELMAPLPVSTRLDRLLASELGVSRGQLQRLFDRGTIRVDPERADIWRRRIKTGTEIAIDLSGEADRERSWGAIATGRRL